MSGHYFDIPEWRIEALRAIHDRTKGDSAVIQRDRLLTILREIGPVSTFELSRFADIYFPPARKFELVADGHNILTTRRTVRTESGRKHSLGVYSLVAGEAVTE